MELFISEIIVANTWAVIGLTCGIGTSPAKGKSFSVNCSKSGGGTAGLLLPSSCPCLVLPLILEESSSVNAGGDDSV
jgi:hypothetical protein